MYADFLLFDVTSVRGVPESIFALGFVCIINDT
jgi:hypothetical protein